MRNRLWMSEAVDLTRCLERKPDTLLYKVSIIHARRIVVQWCKYTADAYHQSPSVSRMGFCLQLVYHQSPSVSRMGFCLQLVYHRSPSVSRLEFCLQLVYHQSPSVSRLEFCLQ